MGLSRWLRRRKWMSTIEDLMWAYTEASYAGKTFDAQFFRHAIIGEITAAPSSWVRYAYKRYPNLRELVVSGSVAGERRPA